MAKPTDAYEARERYFWAERRYELDHAPIEERREAKRDWITALRNPSLLSERAAWLYLGNYGHGAMLAAIDVASASKRVNKVAALAGILAAAEWLCGSREARMAYRELTPSEQDAANAALQAVIDRYSAGDHDD